GDEAVELRKQGDRVHAIIVPVADVDTGAYDLLFTTRAHYLRSSLTTEHGHEILWVGSGGIFQYRRASDVRRALHRELIALTRNYNYATLPTRARRSFLFRLKQAVKRLLR